MALDPAQVALLRARTLPVCADGDPLFAEPWEAKAFAIVVSAVLDLWRQRPRRQRTMT